MKGQKIKIADQRGASAVEFAIILPLLLVFLFGIIEFGIIFYNKAMITNASREGARAGILFRDPRLDQAAITGVVNNYCQDKLLTFGASTVPLTNVQPPTGCVDHNDQLTVTVTYQYDFLAVPNFIPAIPGTITIGTQTEMRCE